MRFLVTLAVALPFALIACTKDEPIRRDRIRNERTPEHNGLVVSQLGMMVRPPAPPQPVSPNECLPGATKLCPAAIMLPGWTAPRRGTMRCSRYEDGIWRFDNEACGTPLVLSFDDTPVVFTKPAGSFTIGPWERTEWISSATPWLALDRDASGCIERQVELFGPPADGSGTNGFDTLARLDDNHDGRIDASDAAYASLVLWTDRDQDRRCSRSEVEPIADAGVVSIDLAYMTPAHVPLGSHEGERATIRFRVPGTDRIATGHVIDVYLRRLD